LTIADADRAGERYGEITWLRLGVKSDKAASSDILPDCDEQTAQSGSCALGSLTVGDWHLSSHRQTVMQRC